MQSAARVWTTAPQTAYARLNDAARLNPLSDEPYLVAGSIALRFGDLARADHEFALALERSPATPMPRSSAGRSPRPRTTAARRSRCSNGPRG